MQTKLDLFFKWGIELNKEYFKEDSTVREVKYAGRNKLMTKIMMKSNIEGSERKQTSSKARNEEISQTQGTTYTRKERKMEKEKEVIRIDEYQQH